MVPFSKPAPASTVSDASAIMPPTTGTTPEMAVFATRTRALSTAPAKIPLTVRYSVKSSSAVVSSQTQMERIISATDSSRLSDRLPPAASVPA